MPIKHTGSISIKHHEGFVLLPSFLRRSVTALFFLRHLIPKKQFLLLSGGRSIQVIYLKQLIINIFLITTYQTTVSNVKEVSGREEPTENYQLNLQLLSAFQSFIVSAHRLSHHNFTVLVHSQRSHSVVFREKAVKSRCTLPAQQQAADRPSQRAAGEHSGAFSS